MKNKDQFINKWAKKLFSLSLDSNGVLSDEFVQALLVTISKNPPRDYRKILKQYLEYIEQEISTNIVIIEHAGIITPTALKVIHRKMNSYYNRELQIVQKLNEKLLAGIRVRVGYDIWDTSILDLLNKLSKA